MTGLGSFPASSAATVFFWFGMTMTKTFATMMVPISAPIWVNAPRPLNTCVKP